MYKQIEVKIKSANGFEHTELITVDILRKTN